MRIDNFQRQVGAFIVREIHNIVQNVFTFYCNEKHQKYEISRKQ